MRKENASIAIVVVLINFFAFAPVPARAAIEVANTCFNDSVALIMTAPVPEANLEAEKDVVVSGRIWAPAIASAFFRCGRLVFFLAPDDNIAVNDCCGRSQDSCCRQSDVNCDEGAGCDKNSLKICSALTKSAFGAYGAGSCRNDSYLPGGLQVKYLNPSQGKEVYRLGEIDMSESGRSSGIGSIFDFKKTFLLPHLVESIGTARIYVQYSGIVNDPLSGWRWQSYVAYQHVKFAGSTGEAAANPRVYARSVSQPDYCTSLSGPAAVFSWDWFDQNKLAVGAYQVQIDKTGNFMQPAVDSGKIGEASTHFATSVGQLDYDTGFFWRVRAWNTEENVSRWSQGERFFTPKHPYPIVKFTFGPKKPTVGSAVTFSEESAISGDNAAVKRLWAFEGGNPAVSGEKNQKVVFAEKGVKKIGLTVTDSDGYTCSDEKYIDVTSSSIIQFEGF